MHFYMKIDILILEEEKKKNMEKEEKIFKQLFIEGENIDIVSDKQEEINFIEILQII